MNRIGDLLAVNRTGFQEIQASRSLADAIDLMAAEGVRTLLVTTGGRPVGIVSATEILDGLSRSHRSDAGDLPVGSIMNPNPGQIDVDAAYRSGLDLLESAGLGYLTVMSGDQVAGVLSGLDLAIAFSRLLDAELDNMNRYLTDLHEAGLD